MALTWQNDAQPSIDDTVYGATLTLYPTFDVLTGLLSTARVEVRRAPDVAGAPGTDVTIANLDPIPARGFVFVDPRPNDGSVWWYSHRHAQASGGWSTWQVVTVQPVIPGGDRLAVPPAMTASMANTHSRYNVSLSQSAVQAIGTGAGTTALSFDTVVLNVGGLFSLGNPTRITIPTINYLGVWMFFMQAAFAANGTGFRQVQFKKNGSDVSPQERQPGNAGINTIHSLTGWTSIDVAPGDYFEAAVAQTSGGNLNVQGFFGALHIW